jgi:ubiquinone/menaquinone biosynthesis C-methylase UbiE
MNYKQIYTEDYFSGNNSFFYKFGYGRFQKNYFDCMYTSVKPYVEEIKEGKVLDVGCAYGYMLGRFPNSFEKYGVDISEHALGEAKKNVPDAALHLAGAEEVLPFPDNYFDVVICNDVIEHLVDPKQAIENLQKVLKKGGLLEIFVFIC